MIDLCNESYRKKITGFYFETMFHGEKLKKAMHSVVEDSLFSLNLNFQLNP